MAMNVYLCEFPDGTGGIGGKPNTQRVNADNATDARAQFLANLGAVDTGQIVNVYQQTFNE